MGGVDCRLDVLGRVLLAADHDQVLLPRREVEVAIGQVFLPRIQLWTFNDVAGLGVRHLDGGHPPEFF